MSRSRLARSAVVLTLVLAAAVAAGCAGDEQSRSSESKSTSLVIAGLVGTPAEGGPDMLNGMKLAAEEVNTAGGVDGHKLVIKEIDTSSTAAGALAAYKEAAADPEVVGSVFVAVTGALALKGQSDTVKLPIVISTASDEVDHPVAKYVFKDAFATEYATSSLVYATRHYKAKRIAELHYGTDYSVALPAALKKRCAELGCEIVASEEGAGDASVDALIPQLTKMRQAKPDAYFIEGLNPAAFAAARQLKIKEPIVSDQWLAVAALRDACAAACKGVTFAIHKSNVPELIADSDPLRDTFLDYRKAFEKAYGEYKGFSIYGYDGVKAIAAAAQKLTDDGKDVTRDNIVAAMERFHGDLRTTHGDVRTAPDNHRLVGTFDQAHIDVAIDTVGGKAAWVAAKGAAETGSTP